MSDDHSSSIWDINRHNPPSRKLKGKEIFSSNFRFHLFSSVKIHVKHKWIILTLININILNYHIWVCLSWGITWWWCQGQAIFASSLPLRRVVRKGNPYSERCKTILSYPYIHIITLIIHVSNGFYIKWKGLTTTILNMSPLDARLMVYVQKFRQIL